MCRLFGASIVNDEKMSTGQIMAVMGANLTGLGPDAYGHAHWRGGNTPVDIRKWRGAADTSQGTRNLMRTVPGDARWVIGHTRLATHGHEAVESNNHPIRHGCIVGAHNGVVSNYATILRDTGREDWTAEVDSEAIMAALHHYNHDGLTLLQGQVAAVWTDTRRPSYLHIARNAWGNDVFLAQTTTGNLLWTSEMEAIDALWPLVKVADWWSVPDDTMVTVRNGEAQDWRSVDFPVYYRQKMTGTPFTFSSQSKAEKKAKLIFSKK